MAGGYERAYGNRIVLEDDGPYIDAGNYNLCPDNNILTTDNQGYPYLAFYGMHDSQGTAPANGRVLIYARPLNLISTNDAEVPQNDCLSIYLGYTVLDADGGDQWQTPPDLVIHRPHFECSIYIVPPIDLNDWSFFCYPWTYRRIQ